MRHQGFASVLVAAACVIGCQQKMSAAAETPTEKPAEKATTPTQQARVSDRPANPDGKVFVAMYHHLGERKDPMFRTVGQFKSDLERMDKMGFRPVTATDYLTNKMNLAPGASPVVMTFDDSNPDQVRLLEDGSVDPTCMLGLWQDFAKSHPEFPIRATFFVLPDVMFGQKKMRDKKIELLKKLGCELANHTVTHPILRKKSDSEVEQEIGDATEDLIQMGVTPPIPLALPFGSSPKNKELLKGFEWHGKKVEPSGIFLVGSNPAPPTSSDKFNRYAIPRIQANEGELGLTYWLDQVQAGKVKVYVQP